jgi:hypothetical protein
VVRPDQSDELNSAQLAEGVGSKIVERLTLSNRRKWRVTSARNRRGRPVGQRQLSSRARLYVVVTDLALQFDGTDCRFQTRSEVGA